MTVEQRLNELDSDLAAVRQLLLSAATYTNRVGEKLDQAVSRQDVTDGQITQLLAAQTATDIKLDRLADGLGENQAQLNQLAESQSQMNQRIDQFVFHAQRLFTQIGTKLENVEGRSQRLEAIIQRLDRNYENQQSQFQEFQRTTNAALERIDRVLDYLLRQSGNENS